MKVKNNTYHIDQSKKAEVSFCLSLPRTDLNKIAVYIYTLRLRGSYKGNKRNKTSAWWTTKTRNLKTIL